MGLWVADERAGLAGPGGCLCGQPLCLCAYGDAVVCATPREARVFDAANGGDISRYPLPPGVRCMCALPDALYCLSSEADSVSLLCPLTGQLRLCAQAGCDPRDLALSPCRRLLAAAGGAAGMLYLYDSKTLTLLRSIPLPGVVYAVCFCPSGLMALCGIEAGDVSTCLYRISARGVAAELLRLPGLPGALLPLPGGGLLVGALGQLLHLRPGLSVHRRYACGLPARLRLYADFALCADPLDGRLLQVPLREGSLRTLYVGEPVDAILV